MDSDHVYVSGSSGTTAYDHDGDRRWHTQDATTFRGLAVDESGMHLKQRGVVSLEPNSGDVRWRSLTDDVPVWTRPSVHEGFVYVGLDDGRCFALDAEDVEAVPNGTETPAGNGNQTNAGDQTNAGN